MFHRPTRIHTKSSQQLIYAKHLWGESWQQKRVNTGILYWSALSDSTSTESTSEIGPASNPIMDIQVPCSESSKNELFTGIALQKPLLSNNFVTEKEIADNEPTTGFLNTNSISSSYIGEEIPVPIDNFGAHDSPLSQLRGSASDIAQEANIDEEPTNEPLVSLLPMDTAVANFSQHEDTIENTLHMMSQETVTHVPSPLQPDTNIHQELAFDTIHNDSLQSMATLVTEYQPQAEKKSHQQRVAHDALMKTISQKPQPQADVKHPTVSRLIKGLIVEDYGTAMGAFNEIQALNKKSERTGETIITISPGIVKGLLALIQPARAFDIYRVVNYYVSIPTSIEFTSEGGNICAYASYYRTACESIRYLDSRRHQWNDCFLLVNALIERVSCLNQHGQEQCVPVLLSAICQQGISKLGIHFAGKIYKHIIDTKMVVSKGFWVHMLSHSKYNRQEDLPYEEILTRVVEDGVRPHPFTVINALENFFPFSNAPAVAKFLKGVLTLQRQVAAEIRAVKISTARNPDFVAVRAKVESVIAKQYFVDMNVLESIGAAAAGQGQSEICLMIWDMLDVLGYTPTEGIYENTILAFAMNAFTYREAFIVLNEMESRGFLPSRALIRSISVHVRYD
jgi:hypothetical protein